jgi:hypothetical protein
MVEHGCLPHRLPGFLCQDGKTGFAYLYIQKHLKHIIVYAKRTFTS